MGGRTKWGGRRPVGLWGAIAPDFIRPTLRPTHSPPGGLWGGAIAPPLCEKKIWGAITPHFVALPKGSDFVGGAVAPHYSFLFFYFVGGAMGGLWGGYRPPFHSKKRIFFYFIRPPLRSPPAGLPVLGG